jgi:hypothetical protein
MPQIANPRKLVEYILKEDREAERPTVFLLRPMTYADARALKRTVGAAAPVLRKAFKLSERAAEITDDSELSDEDVATVMDAETVLEEAVTETVSACVMGWKDFYFTDGEPVPEPVRADGAVYMDDAAFSAIAPWAAELHEEIQRISTAGRTLEKK